MQDINQDFLDMVDALARFQVDFVVVGAWAMAAHGYPRATGDLDILLRPELDNARRTLDALRAFGAPVDEHGMQAGDLARPDTVYQLGLPPRRIDLLTSIDGVDYEQTLVGHLLGHFGAAEVRFIGLDALIANKRSTGRLRDAADVAELEALRGGRGATDVADPETPDDGRRGAAGVAEERRDPTRDASAEDEADAPRARSSDSTSDPSRSAQQEPDTP